MSTLALKKYFRRNFGKIDNIAEIPNLIKVQKESYESFLQMDVSPEQRNNKGLESVLRSIFPVSDYDGRATVEYVSYELGTPKYDIEECIQRGVNYAAPLKVLLRLIIWDIDEDAGIKEIKGIKEQSVYMGEIPLMTDSGTFIINGAQRVIVSQMHRSPGVFYYHDEGKGNIAGKYLYYARIIPYRGSWLDFEFDAKDLLYFRIDRKRKMYVTTLLRVLGYEKDDIIKEFYNFKRITRKNNIWVAKFNADDFKSVKISRDIVSAGDGELIIKAGVRVTPNLIKKLKESYNGVDYELSVDDLLGRYIAVSIIDKNTGEQIISSGDEITSAAIEKIESLGVSQIDILDIDNVRVGSYIRDTLAADKNLCREDALSDIYKILRPGEPVSTEAAESLFRSLFFDPERYDLSIVGRMKINAKHELGIDESTTILTKEDIVGVVKYIILTKDGFGEVDDIDSLGNRRIRAVGELVENQFRLGLVRMERAVVERMNTVEIDTVMPHDLINSKILMSVVREFFGTSQLSQFMDQTNPLSEVTHKRRLSALGPGGLTRERASFEVRDVHPSHYGRICPIETPEGQNIGLINSTATYARINKYGFIESPYRKVVDGKITDEIDYLSAIEESKYTIAQARIAKKGDDSFADEMLTARRKGEYVTVPGSEISYIDVSPKQLVSVAASLIPFLENDDANRALMGSNMQRQAVPLLKNEAPLVGTGMESVVARDSGAVVVAKRDGVVVQLDARRIVIKYDSSDDMHPGIDIYSLTKFSKSNQGTSMNQRPIVSVGDRVYSGDVIADGSCTEGGELALGRNVLVAFMPWNGYNFEDSILVSERISREDIFTSLRIEEFEIIARDTRLGPEEITRDIPNVSEENLRHLDEVGIVHIGAKVKAGDLLVGKIAPKTESPLTPAEKLLRAIFGEKAKDVQDASLRVPSGGDGTVVEVRVFTRRGVDKDERAMVLERAEIEKASKNKEDQVSIIENFTYSKFKELCLGKKVTSAPKNIKIGSILSENDLASLSKRHWWQISIDDSAAMLELEKIKVSYDSSIEKFEDQYKRKIEKIQSGDDLPQGALKVVKVYIAKKLKLQPGDKMAGRHGNKGVVSKIVPIEDMPFLEDGTPVDIVLNPLGVPSRMNVGQILETHLGWASANLGKKISNVLQNIKDKDDSGNTEGLDALKRVLLDIYDSENESGKKVSELIEKMDMEELKLFASNLTRGVPFATPVFDGIKELELNNLLSRAGVESSGQVKLIDGKTGEYFDREVTVGYIYMLKLDHLVDNKIHARSIGPYSLVTQQPLGGKSHFGGQRFGEMECWALQSYGAAYTLQEKITFKSDDITGRIKIYEAIVRGDPVFECGTPESFNVMIKELRSLCLNVEMISDDDPESVADFPKNANGNDFDKIKISIVSPDKIRAWSFGEVVKPDTVNYRTIKPENGGLFCAKIFGPVRDYECLCGKYKRIKYRGIVCEKCGVEVTASKVRRERMGHIELATPVVHIWFLRSLPSRISILLDMSLKDVEKILYFESYIVTDSGLTSFKDGQILSEEEFLRAQDDFGESVFVAETGAEVIKKMLTNLNLEEQRNILRSDLISTASETKRKKIVKRLKLIEQLIESGNKPEWMVLETIPVLPPDLRPLVMLDGGRFATSDLNELYRRVINRNNRLRRLIELKAPDIIIRNEKRMLQESVDALFDNGRRGKALKSSNKRPFRSLADMLKGKQGRFRQNLLGKRVDYSGRSVIVVGPELKLHQCGLPKKMALELFKPFIYAKLSAYGIAATLKAAKKMVELEHPEVWDVLAEVIKQHLVLLNRAPTLHRLGIQAFEPILIEGKAIQLHPLVCSAFNADFDGDQMAVHVPLSTEAQLEARVLMMSTNNILSPANGKPIIVPSQDMILGIYYMTMELNDKGDGDLKVFGSISEIEHALHVNDISLHTRIKYRRNKIDIEGNPRQYLYDTTAGRVLLSEILPKNGNISFDLVNKLMTKKDISALIDTIYRYCGQKSTVIFADHLKQLGFLYATKSGISIGKDDMIIPKSKSRHVNESMTEVRQYEAQYADGLITVGEKYNKTVDAWSRCTDKIAIDMMKIISGVNKEESINRVNSIYMMADSGARGSAAQIKQLAGMRGLMTKPSGEIIETPIISNFKEGLSELEFFTSTHGARKGLADTALKTANSGYLTRKLVDVAQDCVVIEQDCGTSEGLIMKMIVENGEVVVPLSETLLGRVSAVDIYNPITGALIVAKNILIDEDIIDKIDEIGIDSVKVRSVLTCETKGGVCAHCYGRDLSTGKLVSYGEAVGVIAAQSIGEPGTQLTMRTFHIGGAAQKTTVQSSAISSYNGDIKFLHKNTVVDSRGKVISMSRNCEAVVVDENKVEKARYKVPYGANLLLNEGDSIKQGDKIAEWDPFTIPIIVEKSGRASFVDLVENVSYSEILDENTGSIINRVSIDSKSHAKGEGFHPRIILHDENSQVMTLANGLEARYFLPVGAILNISDKSWVHAGDVIARIPKESSKSKDITGGLPRVIELVEARQPKDHSIISEIDGYVEYGRDYKSKRRIIIKPIAEGSEPIEYFIPRSRHITIAEGDYVYKGERLMEGSRSPHDILRVMGVQALAEYMIQEVQQVYRLQGVLINDKHIEVILRQMLQKVEVTDAGGTIFLVNEQIDKEEFEEVNIKATKEGYTCANAVPILQGITKASLQTRSFFSAASFQETTRVLTEAAIAGKIDNLSGLKENVIVGRVVPAGTGLYLKKMKKLAHLRDKGMEE